MKKRIISLGILFALLLGMVNINVLAQSEEVFQEQLSFLVKLGVLSADGDLTQTTQIKRDRFAKEFVTFINRADSVDTTVKPQKSYYFDVGLDNAYLPYINYLTENQYFLGDSQKNYRPSEYITNLEIMKCVVAALGYSVNIADPKDDNGYLSMAGNLGLTASLSAASENATVESMVQLFTNALDVNIMERNLSDPKKFSVNNDLTYLEKTFGIYWVKGQIDGNYLTTLSGKSTTMPEDRITVDGDSYALTEENMHLADYIGYRMKLYFYEDGADRVIVAYKNDKSEELVISAEKIDSFSDNRLYYTLDNEANQRKVEIDPNASVILNGVAVKSYSPDIFTGISNGSVELIKIDGKSTYSVVKIYSYKTYVVGSVSADSNRIITNPRLNEDSIYLPQIINLDDYFHIFIRSVTGMKLKLSDLKANNVLSIGESMDKSVVYITVETKAVQGVVESIRENDDGNKCFVIAGIEYELDADYQKNTNWNVAAKIMVTAYLNYKNQVATVVFTASSDDGWNYGYMMNIVQKETDEEQFRIKIFTSAGKAEWFDIKKKASVDGQNMEKLTADDNGKIDVIEYFTTGDLYEYNNMGALVLKSTKSMFLPQLIKYQVSGGVVTKIDSRKVNTAKGETDTTTLTLGQSLGSYQFFWSTSSKQFVAPSSAYEYSKYNSSLRVSDSTLLFFVPDLSKATQEMYVDAKSNETVYSVKVGFGYFVVHQSYVLEGYDVDFDNGSMAKVLVSPSGESDKWEENIVVQSVEHALNEEDMDCIKIVGYNLGSKQTSTYVLDWNVTTINDFRNTSAEKVQPNPTKNVTVTPIEGSDGLKRGDVIRVKTMSGKVTKIARYFSPIFLDKGYIMDHGVIQSDGTFMGTAGAATDTVMVGVITHAKGNYINFQNVNPDVAYGRKLSSYTIPLRGRLSINLDNNAIYKYSATTGKLELIDAASISNYLYGVSRSAYACVYTNALQLKTIVIYE